jgi:lysophospholipase L1-like esterase
VTAHNWVVAWAGSAQGPYPIGNALLQPDLRFAFPFAERGASNQTFRLIVRPSIWGRLARLRLSNVFGTQPITLEDVFVGVQLGGAAIVPGTSRPVTFAGKRSVRVAPGTSAWSDAADVDFGDGTSPPLARRALVVSFFVAGESGPMTWHAKALTTSYVTPPSAGPQSAVEGETQFPFSVSSWYFLDAVEMSMPPGSFAIVALGDSITEGTGSTFNGDDRWTDVLARRLARVHGNRIAVVNAGIGGNQIAKPETYDALHPFRGGPSAAARIERDVLELSGVHAVIWLEGVNDFSRNGEASLEKVRDAMAKTIGRLRAHRQDIVVIGGTLTSSLGSTNDAHGFPEEDAKRRALNDFIRTSPLFDHVVDFDRVTTDPTTGKLRAEFVPSSSLGGPGDGLHPNRAGYLSMGSAIDLGIFDLALSGLAKADGGR